MKRILLIAAVVLVGIAGIALIDPGVRDVISYRIDPTAKKALALGQKHFDSRRGDAYDIARATKYLEEAYAMDPKYPTLNHELARIAFLKGDFESAMRFIDTEIEQQGEGFPNAFYIRGLIEGYKGDYHAAALDYAVYLRHDPTNWAAINDYAWVLLKVGRTDDALLAVREGLRHFPDNAWLLNSETIALYEIGEYEQAARSAIIASTAVERIEPKDWLRAYPGNDPKIAAEGIRSLREAIHTNMHMAARAASTLR